jgi:hypothetical protein
VPSSLRAPDVQWENGELGDLFRVTITAGLARVTAYLVYADGFKLDWWVDATSWSRLLRSDARITFVVDRWSVADQGVHGSAAHAIEVSSARLEGAIYYWDLSDGRIMRIDHQGRQVLMPSPPARSEDGLRCVACHTVSRDGRYLSAALWLAEGATVFDLTSDLSTDPTPTMFPADRYRAVSSTFNPDGTRLLVMDGNTMNLVDPMSGTLLPASGLPSLAAHPTWSPDGTLVAYIANHDGAAPVDFTRGDLAVFPVLGGDAFGGSATLRPADGLANSWPSFSPDSRWIAYGRGQSSRGSNVSIGVAHYPGSLWMVSRAGGLSVELANANGTGMDSYMPNFSPFDEGGYFWLVFYSKRDYGNTLAGTKGTGRRQLWITAVARDPQLGVEDPSSVPYWLPDQDVSTHNISAYWSLPPSVD